MKSEEDEHSVSDFDDDKENDFDYLAISTDDDQNNISSIFSLLRVYYILSSMLYI